jgi:hypothetical protein
MTHDDPRIPVPLGRGVVKTIFAIDPGPEKSAFLIWNGGKVLDHGHVDNYEMRQLLIGREYDIVAIEMIASYGMKVGASVFETCYWVGRFSEVARSCCEKCYRKDIKKYLCGTLRSKDKDIRKALLDRVGEQGTTKNQGPTCGLKSHTWAALAVALYAESIFKGNSKD